MKKGKELAKCSLYGAKRQARAKRKARTLADNP